MQKKKSKQKIERKKKQLWKAKMERRSLRRKHTVSIRPIRKCVTSLSKVIVSQQILINELRQNSTNLLNNFGSRAALWQAAMQDYWRLSRVLQRRNLPLACFLNTSSWAHFVAPWLFSLNNNWIYTWSLSPWETGFHEKQRYQMQKGPLRNIVQCSMLHLH